MDSYRIIEIICSAAEDNASLERVLRGRGYSRRIITAMKRIENGITRDGKLCRSIDNVFEGDVIRLKIPEGSSRQSEVMPCCTVVEKAYEDSDYVIYDKLPLMPVHRSFGHVDDTLENVFYAEYPDIPFRPVYRLDRDTSGLCLAAKNKLCANITGGIDKVYFAVCCGVISEPMTIDAPIALTDEQHMLRAVSPEGKRAVTHISPVVSENGYTLLRIRLETGRTHQIRVHMSHIGFPLAGDKMYGGNTEHISRQALHCGEISFIHPVIGERICIRSQLPNDIVQIVQADNLQNMIYSELI